MIGISANPNVISTQSGHGMSIINWLWMYVDVFPFAAVCRPFSYVYLQMPIDLCIYMQGSVFHIYMCIFMYICIYLYMYLPKRRLYTYPFVCTSICGHVDTDKYIRTHSLYMHIQVQILGCWGYNWDLPMVSCTLSGSL